MKLYLDTEFNGLTKDAELISLGIVSEDNSYFYGILKTNALKTHDLWIKENVIKHLDEPFEWAEKNKINTEFWVNRLSKVRFRNKLISYLKQFNEIEIYSDCLAYDWVLFCDLFGGALEIPDNIYYIPFDLSTALKYHHIDPDIKREDYSYFGSGMNKHNSLHDAIVIKGCFERIENEGTLSLH